MKKLVALLAIGLISGSAFAATYDFYGSVMVQAFYGSPDKYKSGIGKSDTDLEFGTQGNSRIGANVKASDKLTANFELGLGTYEDGSNRVSTRLIYATYDFGPLKMKIGQDYTPTEAEPFNQVYFQDNALDGFGGFSTGRRSQIAFTFGDFEFAVVANNQTDKKNFDVIIPKLEAAYNYKFGPASGKIFGGYQTYKYDNATSDKSVNAYVAGLTTAVELNPVVLNAVAWYGLNTADYGATTQGSYDVVHDKDSTDFGVSAELGFKATKDILLNVGYGYQRSDSDAFMKADGQQSYYANAIINIAKNLYVTPEVGVLDYMKSATDLKEGKKLYYGVQVKANF
ncbi:MAG: hypothetical protein ACP5LO_08790 [Calditerrivibrio sp.]|uniref:hypothetical protein n=1 Tax=Calditerrivibrio sp. TaxID=2792612 RepID=UPI003D09E792